MLRSVDPHGRPVIAVLVGAGGVTMESASGRKGIKRTASGLVALLAVFSVMGCVFGWRQGR